MTAVLIMEAFNAAIMGVLISVLLWMWCHRAVYSWRDFGMMFLLILSMTLRFIKGEAPESHFLGIMTMNLLFVMVAALIWARPSKIPPCEKQADCILVRIWNWLYGVIRHA